MASRAGVKAGNAFVEIHALDMTRNVLSNVGRHFASVMNQLNTIGMQSLAGLFALGLPVKKAISTFSDFDDMIRRVEAHSRGTDAQMQALSKQARQLGKDTAFSAMEVASLQHILAQGGLDRQQVFDATPGVLGLALAGSTGNPLLDAENAAKAVTAAINGFNLPASEAVAIADKLATAAKFARFPLEDLGIAIPYVARTAADFGANFDTVISMLIRLKKTGMQASTVGAALRNVFNRIGDADYRTKLNEMLFSLTGQTINFADAQGNFRAIEDILFDLGDAIKDLGTMEQKDILGQMFGDRTLSAALTLKSGKNIFADLLNEIKNSKGEVDRAKAIMEGGIGGVIRRLAGSIEEVAHSYTEAIYQILSKGGTLLDQFFDKFSNWITQNKTLVAGISFVTASLLVMGTSLLLVTGLIRLIIQPITLAISLFRLFSNILMLPVAGIGTILNLVSAMTRLNYGANLAFKGIARLTNLAITGAVSIFNFATSFNYTKGIMALYNAGLNKLYQTLLNLGMAHKILTTPMKLLGTTAFTMASGTSAAAQNVARLTHTVFAAATNSRALIVANNAVSSSATRVAGALGHVGTGLSTVVRTAGNTGASAAGSLLWMLYSGSLYTKLLEASAGMKRLGTTAFTFGGMKTAAQTISGYIGTTAATMVDLPQKILRIGTTAATSVSNVTTLSVAVAQTAQKATIGSTALAVYRSTIQTVTSPTRLVTTATSLLNRIFTSFISTVHLTAGAVVAFGRAFFNSATLLNSSVQSIQLAGRAMMYVVAMGVRLQAIIFSVATSIGRLLPVLRSVMVFVIAIIGRIGSMMALIALNPVTVTIAALAGAFYLVYQNFDKLVNRFTTGFENIRRNVTDTTSSIKNGLMESFTLLSEGEFEAAFTMITATLKVTWLSLIDFMYKAWEEFAGKIASTLQNKVSRAFTHIIEWTYKLTGAGKLVLGMSWEEQTKAAEKWRKEIDALTKARKNSGPSQAVIDAQKELDILLEIQRKKNETRRQAEEADKRRQLEAERDMDLEQYRQKVLQEIAANTTVGRSARIARVEGGLSPLDALEKYSMAAAKAAYENSQRKGADNPNKKLEDIGERQERKLQELIEAVGDIKFGVV